MFIDGGTDLFLLVQILAIFQDLSDCEGLFMILQSLFIRTLVFVSLLKVNDILGQLWVPPDL